MKRIIVGLALLAVVPAYAQSVYKCKDENGTTVFSDAPCGKGAQKVEVRSYHGSEPASALKPGAEEAAMPNPEPQIDKLKRQADLAANERRQRQIGFDIDIAEGNIRRYQAEMESRITTIRARKAYANNNLSGATWENSLSQEMSAVSGQYNGLIADEREKIKALGTERESLRKALRQ